MGKQDGTPKGIGAALIVDAALRKPRKVPTRSLVTIDDVGVAAAFLAHDAARLIIGETLYIDGGYHIIDYSASHS